MLAINVSIPNLELGGPGNHVLDGVQIPHGKGQIFGEFL